MSLLLTLVKPSKDLVSLPRLKVVIHRPNDFKKTWQYTKNERIVDGNKKRKLLCKLFNKNIYKRKLSK